jgi:S-(hydroxymethyl)glutathione dehydrogenase/alcohol dehydrogenase
LIQDVTYGRMCNVVILTKGVGEGSMIADYMTLVSKAGKLVVTNVHPGTEGQVSLSLQDLTFSQKQIRGSCFGSGNPRADVPKFIDLYRRGLLDLDSLITKTYSLSEVNAAYDDMKAGRNIRGVISFS